MRSIFNQLTIIAIVAFVFTSCKKEESLTPNEEATRLFQDSSLIVIGGGGGTSGGGTGGGGSLSTEFFEFKVDGTTINGVNPEYRPGITSGASIASHFNSLTNVLQFGFFSEPTTTGPIAVSAFFPSASFIFNVSSNPSDIYTAIDGELNITEVNSSKIAGTFFFRADQNPPVDTIMITEGRFSINK